MMQYVLIGFAAACLAAVVVLSLKLASALRDVNAAGDLFRAQARITDSTVDERDAFKKELDTARLQIAGHLKALSDAEARITKLASEVVRLKTKSIATAPLEEGAAIVNAGFATPLKGPK